MCLVGYYIISNAHIKRSYQTLARGIIVNPNGDENEISLNVVNNCSNIQVMRIKR